LDQPIRPALRYVRLVTGITAISFGSLLFWAGDAVAPEPVEALLLIVYLCVGAYWVLSFSFNSTTVRRFSLEMVLFIVVTLGIRLTSPHLFDLGKLSRSLAAPPRVGGTAGETEVKKTSAAQLKQDAWDLNRTTRRLIAGELKEEQQFTDMVTNIKNTYRNLPAKERDRLEPNYRAAIDLDKAVKAWKSHPAAANNEKIYELIEKIDTFDW